MLYHTTWVALVLKAQIAYIVETYHVTTNNFGWNYSWKLGETHQAQCWWGGCFYYFLVAGALLFGWNLDNSFECVLVVNMMELCGCYQCCEGSHINVNLMVSITSIKISISNPYKKPYKCLRNLTQQPIWSRELVSNRNWLLGDSRFKLELSIWEF